MQFIKFVRKLKCVTSTSREHMHCSAVSDSSPLAAVDLARCGDVFRTTYL